MREQGRLRRAQPTPPPCVAQHNEHNRGKFQVSEKTVSGTTLPQPGSGDPVDESVSAFQSQGSTETTVDGGGGRPNDRHTPVEPYRGKKSREAWLCRLGRWYRNRRCTAVFYLRPGVTAKKLKIACRPNNYHHVALPPNNHRPVLVLPLPQKPLPHPQKGNRLPPNTR